MKPQIASLCSAIIHNRVTLVKNCALSICQHTGAIIKSHESTLQQGYTELWLRYIDIDNRHFDIIIHIYKLTMTFDINGQEGLVEQGNINIVYRELYRSSNSVCSLNCEAHVESL